MPAGPAWLAASWMIERLAADSTPDPAFCDLPLAATQPKPTNPGGADDYARRIAGDISFLHDIQATREGAPRCACR